MCIGPAQMFPVAGTSLPSLLLCRAMPLLALVAAWGVGLSCTTPQHLWQAGGYCYSLSRGVLTTSATACTAARRGACQPSGPLRACYARSAHHGIGMIYWQVMSVHQHVSPFPSCHQCRLGGSASRPVRTPGPATIAASSLKPHKNWPYGIRSACKMAVGMGHAC